MVQREGRGSGRGKADKWREVRAKEGQQDDPAKVVRTSWREPHVIRSVRHVLCVAEQAQTASELAIIAWDDDPKQTISRSRPLARGKASKPATQQSPPGNADTTRLLLRQPRHKPLLVRKLNTHHDAKEERPALHGLPSRQGRVVREQAGVLVVESLALLGADWGREEGEGVPVERLATDQLRTARPPGTA